ncbi:MAG: sucrase ferredoxin [Nitriliruptoraceae bacterium]
MAEPSGRGRPDGCAVRSRRCAEPQLGTASRAHRWLLVEQPGGWGPDALTSSGLPDRVADHLRALQRTLPARVLLLRRPGRVRSPVGSRSVYVGWSDQQDRWLERFDLEDLREIAALDLRPLSGGGSVGGAPVTAPVYLVCTNGGHDPCCAEYGRPVARALERVVGERVWECSHVGGDRFAANLVCLPDGQFYGRLEPASAVEVVAAHEQGRIALEYWRGRSSLGFAEQAAEGFARTAFDLAAGNDLRFLGSRQDGDRRHVRFVRPTGEMIEVVVEVSRRRTHAPLTCSGTGRVTFEVGLVTITQGGGG